MPSRKKRSISVPPALDARIEAAAREVGMTYSGWVATMAAKEFTIQAGLEAVAQFEREQGPFTADEIAEAKEWTVSIGGRRSGARRQRTA